MMVIRFLCSLMSFLNNIENVKVMVMYRDITDMKENLTTFHTFRKRK